MAIQLSGSLEILGNIIASGGITGSFSGSATSASYADNLQGLGSASFAPAGTFNTVSQSFATTSGSIASRVNVIETSYATTGSNNFTKPQQISDVSNAISFTSTASLYTDGGLRVKGNSFVSGTAYFNDVVVYGTSSIEYITSSQLAIGTNIITLNTDTPSIRFGGISVFDSGSNNLSTGSLFWDSEKDKWIYSNPSASTYDGGMLISGPRNTSGLGNEVGTTSCALMMGQGGDHITSSAIFSYGNATCFYGQSYISSSGAACFSNTVCAPQLRISNTGDLSYVYNSGASTTDANFYIYSATKDILMVRNSGCIGIGTANPTKALEIVSNTSQDGIKISGASNPRLTIIDTTNSVQFDALTTDTEVVLRSDTNHPLHLSTNGTLRLNIANTGIACFACQVCAPRINVQSCMSIGNIATTYARLDINQDGSSTVNSVGVGCPPGLKIYADAGVAPFMVMSQSTRGTMTMGMQAAAAIPANFVLGLDVCGDLAFKNQMTSYCDLSTGTSLLFICRNGNVAIGNASATFGLTVYRPSTTQGDTSTNLLLFDTTAYATGVGGGISFGGYYNNTNSEIYTYGYVKGGKENSTNDTFAGYVSFGTRASASGASAERMRIMSGGNVGIGTTDNTAAYRLNVSNNGGSAYIGVTNQSGAAGDRYLRIGFGTGATVASIQGTRVNVADDVNLALQPDGGNVGIGTISPQLNTNSGKFLTVQSSVGSGWLELATSTTTDGLGGALSFNNTNRTGTDKRIAQIAGVKDGANDTGAMSFVTWNAGTGVERMRISCNGAVYINTSSNQLANATPALGILAGATCDAVNIKHVQNGNNAVNIWQTGTSAFGAIVFYKGNTQDERGNITVSTTGTAYNSVSDYRLKENVTPSTCGLDRLMQLKPSKFNWIENGIEAEGFIAHELQEVFPDAVTGEKDGVYSSTGKIKPQSVDYGRITPLLVKALQEQQCTINTLKTCLGII